MSCRLQVKVGILLLSLCAYLTAGLVQTYTFEKPQISGDSAISLENCAYTFNTGTPAIPVKPVMLLLPQGEKAVSYSISYGDAQYEELPFDIRPIAPGQILSSKKPAVAPGEYRSEVYSVDAFYPALARGGDFSEMKKNGHRVFVATINPVRYNPVSRTLCYYSSVTVSVKTESAPRENGMYKFDPLVERNLKALVDNADQVSQLPAHKPSEEDYDYLIITKSSLVTSFQDFVDFNKTRCMKTKVVAVETVLSSSQGSDDPEKIRNFIREEYEASKITYVLLGGDVEAIPHRGFDAELYDYGTDHFHFHQIPADMYYACLDGTWKKAGSRYYGEPGSEDNGFEVYVARITVETSKDVENFTTKTSRFVTAPVKESVTNIALAGEYLWSKPSAVYGDEHMDELVSTCHKNSYTTEGIASDIDIDKSLYGRINPSWERYSSSMPNMIKSFEPTWISHLGHCGTDYTMGFRNGNVTKSNFPQDGITSNYFFVYTQGCYPNAFDNCRIGSPLNNEASSGSFGSDCVSEKLTLLETGCVAFLGNTRFGFGSTQGTDGSNQRFMRWFHHALFGEGINTLEMMNAFSKEKNAAFWMDTDVNSGPYYGQCRWVCYQLNLLGDPALAMYTETPETLEATYPDTLTTKTLAFETEPYARVALLDSDSAILYRTVADESGTVTFDSEECQEYLTNNPKGELEVRIYADNHLPFAGEMILNVVVTGTLTAKSGVQEHSLVLSKGSSLLTFSYFLAQASPVEITVCNSQGKIVKQYKRSLQRAGMHKKELDVSGLSAGVYMCSITSNKNEKTFKLSLGN